VVDEKPSATLAVSTAFEKRKIEMHLDCSYESLGGYLAALSMLPTFFSVEGLEVTSTPRLLPKLEVKLVLGFYVTKALALP
jgi:hypothetical protein